MEEKNKRIQRFKNGPPLEVIETLLYSIDNFFNNEIDMARKRQQPHLIILGIHAVALTISEALFNLQGPTGYKAFLEKFIDGDKPDIKFSKISDDIHKFRNNIAHQWLSESGYTFGIDTTTQLGWHKRNDITLFNPYIYCDKYIEAFSSNGKIREWKKLLTNHEQESAKNKIIKKYHQ